MTTTEGASIMWCPDQFQAVHPQSARKETMTTTTENPSTPVESDALKATTGVVLYGADGTKYVITDRELAQYEAAKVPPSQIPTVGDFDPADDVQPLTAFHAPALHSDRSAFFFLSR